MNCRARFPKLRSKIVINLCHATASTPSISAFQWAEFRASALEKNRSRSKQPRLGSCGGLV